MANDDPIDPLRMAVMEEHARMMGKFVDVAINRTGVKTIGFCLMFFSFDGPEFTYISNSQRDDMIKVLKEMVGKLETHQDQPPMPFGTA